MYDVIVVGCGASGAMASICASRRGLNVAVIEAESRGFRKLLTTGNGRCNLTNRQISPEYYNENSKFIFDKVYQSFDATASLDFFREIGVENVELEDGKVYPMSLKAASVVNDLLDEMKRCGVQMINEFPLTKIKKSNVFEVYSGEKKLSAKAIILAFGSKAGIKEKPFNMGYNAIDSLKLRKVPISPSLVQLKSDYKYLKHLNGTKFKTTATLLKEDTEVKSFFGEVLFTDYGLSGIPIMNLSRFFTASDKKGYKVRLDLVENLNFNELLDLLKIRRKNIGYKTLESFFVGMIPKSLIVPLIKDNELNMNDLASKLSDKELKQIASYLKGFSINITDTNPFSRAQVMAGGIDVHELNDNLSLKKDRDLFLVGELVDVDGLCGGFNLQWAWSSGHMAGESVLNYDN